MVGGSTFATATPTMATLANGKVVVISSGSILVLDATLSPGNPLQTTAPAQTGIFQGEPYSVGSNGIVVIDGSTFATATPTTATLADGKIVAISSGSILVLNAAQQANQTPFAAIAGLSSGHPLQTTAPAQTGIFQGETFSVGSNGIVVIGGSTFATATPTTATLADGKIVVVWPSGSVSVSDASQPQQKYSVTPKEYLIGAILPTLLAVVFSIPWYLLASAIQEIEPFYQLQRPEGVSAENSIALDYRASISIVATFNAFRKGHFLVWWSGLASMVVLIVPPLASESVFIGFVGECTATSGRKACTPSLNVYPVAARILEGLLAFIAVVTLALVVAILRGRSGVYANPLSIAGLATLFQNSQVIESFRRLNPYCTSTKMITSGLRGRQYRITNYVDDEGNPAYGLVMCYQDPAAVQLHAQTSTHAGKKYASVSVTAMEEHTRPLPQRTLTNIFVHPITIVIFAVLVVGLEVWIIYYGKTEGDTRFERFMDGQSFGVGFLFTAIGVMLKMYWSLLDSGKSSIPKPRPTPFNAIR